MRNGYDWAKTPSHKLNFVFLCFQCEHLVEEYEEEMVSSFRKDTQDIEKHICCDMTGRSIPLEKIPKI